MLEDMVVWGETPAGCGSACNCKGSELGMCGKHMFFIIKAKVSLPARGTEAC